MLKNTLEKKELSLLERKIPIKRLCRPKDIASLVIFLIEKNKYINGQTIVIDGGLTISSNF
jgi:Dehydrogenases with different specificities (related to short-chain alcohol dehydrogenases)